MTRVVVALSTALVVAVLGSRLYLGDPDSEARVAAEAPVGATMSPEAQTLDSESVHAELEVNAPVPAASGSISGGAASSVGLSSETDVERTTGIEPVAGDPIRSPGLPRVGPSAGAGSSRLALTSSLDASSRELSPSNAAAVHERSLPSKAPSPSVAAPRAEAQASVASSSAASASGTERGVDPPSVLEAPAPTRVRAPERTTPAADRTRSAGPESRPSEPEAPVVAEREPPLGDARESRFAERESPIVAERELPTPPRPAPDRKRAARVEPPAPLEDSIADAGSGSARERESERPVEIRRTRLNPEPPPPRRDDPPLGPVGPVDGRQLLFISGEEIERPEPTPEETRRITEADRRQRQSRIYGRLRRVMELGRGPR